MTLFAGLIGTLLCFIVLINMVIQFSDTAYVTLFRVKQVLTYLVAICLCIIPFIIETNAKWVCVVLGIFFFVESFLARDDYFYWLEIFEEEKMKEANGEEEKK